MAAHPERSQFGDNLFTVATLKERATPTDTWPLAHPIIVRKNNNYVYVTIIQITATILMIQVQEVLYFLTAIVNHAKKEDRGVQHPAARIAREILWPEVRKDCIAFELITSIIQ